MFWYKPKLISKSLETVFDKLLKHLQMSKNLWDKKILWLIIHKKWISQFWLPLIFLQYISHHVFPVQYFSAQTPGGPQGLCDYASSSSIGLHTRYQILKDSILTE